MLRPECIRLKVGEAGVARDLLALADATASAAIIDTDAAEIRAAASDLRDALAVRS